MEKDVILQAEKLYAQNSKANSRTLYFRSDNAYQNNIYKSELREFFLSFMNIFLLFKNILDESIYK